MSWRPLVEVLPSVDSQASQPGQSGQSASPAAAAEGELPPLDLSSLAGLQGSERASEGLYSGHVAPAHQAPPSEVDGLRRAAFSTAGKSNEPSRAPPNVVASAYEQAKQQGYEEGSALSRAEHEAIALRLRTSIEELVTAREQTIAACEADLVRLALAVAREVLMADVVGREDFAQRMAQHAMQTLGGADPVTLRMSPRDVQSLRQHKPEMAHRKDVQLVEDASIEIGGIVAEGARGRMDATLDARLAEVRDKLLGGDGQQNGESA